VSQARFAEAVGAVRAALVCQHDELAGPAGCQGVIEEHVLGWYDNQGKVSGLSQAVTDVCASLAAGSQHPSNFLECQIPPRLSTA